MRKNKTIAVRYCGGCNPRFDRVGMVKNLESMFPDYAFVSAEPGKHYAAVIAACGCAARCVRTADLLEPLIYLNGWEETADAFAIRLNSILKDTGEG